MTSADTIAARMRALAADGNGTFEAAHEPSFWLRARLADLRTRHLTSQFKACPHLRVGVPAVVALWAPDRVVCVPRCARTLRLTGDADRTCDRCGTVADRVHPEIAAPSPGLVVVFGLCPACHRREGAT